MEQQNLHAVGIPNRNVQGISQAEVKQHLSFSPSASSSLILQHMLFPTVHTQC